MEEGRTMPDDARIWKSRGLRAVRAGDQAQAQRCFVAARDADPGDLDVLLWLAWLAPTRQESLSLLAQVLDVDPANERARAGIRWARRRPETGPATATAQAIPPRPDTAPPKPPDRSVRRGPGLMLPLTILATVALLALAAALGSYYAPQAALASLLPGPAIQAAQSTPVAALPSIVADPSPTPRAELPAPTQLPASPTPIATATSRAGQPTAAPYGLASASATVTATLPPPSPTPQPSPTAVPWPTATRPPVIPIPSPSPTTEWAITHDQKWIDVNLTEQVLTAYQGSVPVFRTSVSTGLPGTPTVTGEYHIYWKLVSTLMVGADYYLPDVPYTMYFYNDYALHGTYWHSNFGQPMSHGCVNLRNEDAHWLFDWAAPVLPPDASQVTADESNPGTLVVVRP